MWVLAREFASSEDGASLLEYSLLIGLITAAIVGFMSSVGGNLTTIWSTVASVVATAA